jgi:hypothetical protein
MNIQSLSVVTPLRQRLIEDMTARNLGRHSQRSHLSSCERFAGFLERSPDTHSTIRHLNHNRLTQFNNFSDGH